MTLALTAAMMATRWPAANHSLVDGMIASSEQTFARFGIADAQDAADFMAQISEETGNGTAIEENLNYSASRLTAVWPRMFPTLAAAQPYAGNPRLLADKVYGGRYGNRPDTDDGYAFRGSGGIELTFRGNYEMIGSKTGLDLVDNPDLVNVPANFLVCAAAFWMVDGVNALATAGDFRGETARINGGLINFSTRLAQRALWRPMFGLPAN